MIVREIATMERYAYFFIFSHNLATVLAVTCYG